MNNYKKYGEYSKDNTQSDTLKVALTFLAIGAGVGALVSLFLSSRSGAEIRQAIGGKLDDARRSLNEQSSRFRRRAGDVAAQTREKILPISQTR